ncbi:YqcC family protein [Psychromonas sp.]|uniref:YqcC family protein n=1 Tax=Psychromonas sp. TaxID=1884585 RepID=UPI003561806C
MLNNEVELDKQRLLLPLLQQLENELRNKGLWQEVKPSQQALASRAPFAIDSLSFAQWLQFIFLDKMRELVRFSQPLPESMLILPMATEYFKSLPLNSAEIINIISRIDDLFTE